MQSLAVYPTGPKQLLHPLTVDGSAKVQFSTDTALVSANTTDSVAGIACVLSACYLGPQAMSCNRVVWLGTAQARKNERNKK